MYLHGHGIHDKGSEVGTGLAVVNDNKDLYTYAYDEVLNDLLSSSPGQIIFLPDTCFSGGFVKAAKHVKGNKRLHVISSSAIDQESTDMLDIASRLLLENDQGIGRYTNALAYGLSRKIPGNRYSYVKADVSNPDGVSIYELFKWIKNDGDVKDAGQKVEIYSQSNDMIIFE